MKKSGNDRIHNKFLQIVSAGLDDVVKDDSEVFVLNKWVDDGNIYWEPGSLALQVDFFFFFYRLSHQGSPLKPRGQINKIRIKKSRRERTWSTERPQADSLKRIQQRKGRASEEGGKPGVCEVTEAKLL